MSFHIAAGGGESNFITICEGELDTLSCPEGEQIVVLEAFYGRKERDICSSGSAVENLKCADPFITSRVADQCVGATRCTVEADSGFFGDPCVGTSKYLQVLYSCIRKSYNVSYTRIG